MFHHVYVNFVRTTIESSQYLLRKDFQQHIFKRQDRRINYVTVFHRKIFKDVRYLTTSQDVLMHSFVALKRCHVTTVLKQQLFSKSIFSSISYHSTHCTKPVIMASTCFKGHSDHYNGVTVDSNEEFCVPEIFTQRLKVSLQHWINGKKRTIWFRIHLLHSELIPILVKQKFKFHHAREEYVMLYRWLVTDEECNVPHYAHTNLGVGAFVYNETNNEILVIKEKYVSKAAFWKLPGGYVEPGEDIEAAVKREVLEETGIQTTFKCILGFRHAHEYAFNCSDIYIIIYLSPVNFDIKKCDREISECQWMKLNDYMEHLEVHENNKMIAKKILEFFKHRIGLTVEYAVHPILKKPISVYSMSKINDA